VQSLVRLVFPPSDSPALPTPLRHHRLLRVRSSMSSWTAGTAVAGTAAAAVGDDPAGVDPAGAAPAGVDLVGGVARRLLRVPSASASESASSALPGMWINAVEPGYTAADFPIRVATNGKRRVPPVGVLRPSAGFRDVSAAERRRVVVFHL
jgi:hypothetical protein